MWRASRSSTCEFKLRLSEPKIQAQTDRGEWFDVSGQARSADWAAAELKESAENVKPYSILPPDILQVLAFEATHCSSADGTIYVKGSCQAIFVCVVRDVVSFPDGPTAHGL
jgi:hypothetical protein